MYRIGVMGGDGVGPELVTQGLRVLEAVSARYDIEYELAHYPHGGNYYRSSGIMIEDTTIDEIGELDAFFFGAVGDPELPEGTMERGLLLPLVERLDLGVGVRPAQLYREQLTPLRAKHTSDLDIVIVRDTTEDCFVVPGGRLRPDTPHEVSIGLLVYTQLAVERTTRYAFELAAKRRGQVTVVSQANAVPSHTIWPRVAHRVAAEYPRVALSEHYPDAAAMFLVTAPERFDVILTTYWIGGILTDLLGALVGGVGVLGSARLNVEARRGLFEPAHGSAPKYTGKDRVSPIGQINALALLLDHLREPAAAEAVRRAVASAVGSGRIPNVNAHGPMGTTEATDQVIAALEK
jgi:3-isopropylmalate dehydrogenase